MSDCEIINEAEEIIIGKPTVIRNASDLQRMKLEKLMKYPDKPVLLPEKPKERGVPVVPEFVRNVMGSSAGAGSGEFHVYRHLRRKEYARQKYMKEKGERDRLDDDYHKKLEDNKRKAEERTAKKRAKRLKQKNRKGRVKSNQKSEETSESENDMESNDNEAEISEKNSNVDQSEPDAHEKVEDKGSEEHLETTNDEVIEEKENSNSNDKTTNDTNPC